MDYDSDFQPVSSHGTHKLITKIPQHAGKKNKNMFLAHLSKIGIILIHSHWMPIGVLAVVIFYFDNLREKMSVPLTKKSGITCFKDSHSTPVKKSLDYEVLLSQYREF